ncbi:MULTISPECIES: glycosyltransferase [Paenibacillus]|uniref:Family 2 glycosyl transferase n=1 Tax=Paenibacillus naphthalenovorans TaxID=162209 RepID=A0A0U2KVU0_9BACL|nr:MULTISPECIES: glycosyltransferase [Paenibacillus]ALS20722.1 family 2 glycosyl transferase [Paenibacillus naphthalenovorans]GCL70752.1 glycosyltransferase family 2 protein [Paenibacillus naphthalenovorans]SDI24246.1 Glycosyl transferase family 2 [Paenibacillus naphthalenovorans]
MKVTVAICTFNRAEYLEKTINSVLVQSYPDTEYEILIIDNNSTDHTAQLVMPIVEKEHHVRYVLEVNKGLSYARNRAIAEAKGEFILFLDDDATACQDWIRHILDCFQDEKVACVGGKINPVWEKSVPTWLPERYYSLYTILDYSDKVTEMDHNSIPFGANVAFRKDVLKKYGCFRTDLGRVGNNLLSGEESELIRKIRKDYIIMYTPYAFVNHTIASNRINKKWFLRRLYWQGVSDVIRVEKKLKRLKFFIGSNIRIVFYLVYILFNLSEKKKTIHILAKLMYRLGVVRYTLTSVMKR